MMAPETIEKIKQLMTSASVFEEDLDESFILGSGPGGQKVNKTSSTVRLYHEPSKLTVKYGQTRSREMNRWLARRELAEKILEKEQSALSKRRQEQERVRRQKRRRSRRQKARMLDDKRQHGEKKAARGRVNLDE
ncbi:MAG: peptide chain release factor-like protein [Kiritimatiellaeota bacterium]|nr:peptide chain release factor-like protein [Kiritimatiellota bacterium]